MVPPLTLRYYALLFRLLFTIHPSYRSTLTVLSFYIKIVHQTVAPAVYVNAADGDAADVTKPWPQQSQLV